jgi:ubiquinol-cytochrome c reductase cytochrome b subunit
MWPSWRWNMLGHTWAFNVFLPAFVPLGIIMTALAFWPFLEQWVTGDRREHHVNERPRNAPTRTALGMAGVSFYGIMWLEGANDLIARWLYIPLYVTTEIARYAVFIGPVVAYFLTKRICLGLQRKDNERLVHGYETGIIRQLPSGEYVEIHRPVSDDYRAVLEARTELPQLAAPATGMAHDDDVPARHDRGQLGKLRTVLYRAVTESVPLPTGDGHGNGQADGHGDGHADGHGDGHATEPAAVTAAEPGPAQENKPGTG